MSTIDDLLYRVITRKVIGPEWRYVLTSTWKWLEGVLNPKILALPTSAIVAEDGSVVLTWDDSGMALTIKAHLTDDISWRVSSGERVLYEETRVGRHAYTGDSIRTFLETMAATDSIPGPHPRVLELIQKGYLSDFGWIDAFSSKYGLPPQARRELIASIMRAVNSAVSSADATNKPPFDF